MAKLYLISENKSKFKIFKVDRDYKAKGDALWYMHKTESLEPLQLSLGLTGKARLI